jgi:Raf kinase inhibitor-like YbhB/YbcL family protein
VALVVTDPDAPRGTFVHWVLYDLPGQDGELSAGQVPAGARQGENSAGKSGWYPPCPPSGTHRYVFTVYSLQGRPEARRGQGLLDSIVQATTAKGSLTGTVAAG